MKRGLLLLLSIVFVFCFWSSATFAQETEELSLSYPSEATCESNRSLNNIEYPDYIRSDCFAKSDKYYYYICDKGSAHCGKTDDWKEVNPYKYQISEKMLGQLDAFLKKMEKADIKKIKGLLKKLDTLSRKYSSNERLSNIIGYLRVGLEKILEKKTDKDDLKRFFCELRWDCPDDVTCSWITDAGTCSANNKCVPILEGLSCIPEDNTTCNDVMIFKSCEVKKVSHFDMKITPWKGQDFYEVGWLYKVDISVTDQVWWAISSYEWKNIVLSPTDKFITFSDWVTSDDRYNINWKKGKASFMVKFWTAWNQIIQFAERDNLADNDIRVLTTESIKVEPKEVIKRPLDDYLTLAESFRKTLCIPWDDEPLWYRWDGELDSTEDVSYKLHREVVVNKCGNYFALSRVWSEEGGISVRYPIGKPYSTDDKVLCGKAYSGIENKICSITCEEVLNEFSLCTKKEIEKADFSITEERIAYNSGALIINYSYDDIIDWKKVAKEVIVQYKRKLQSDFDLTVVRNKKSPIVLWDIMPSEEYIIEVLDAKTGEKLFQHEFSWEKVSILSIWDAITLWTTQTKSYRYDLWEKFIDLGNVDADFVWSRFGSFSTFDDFPEYRGLVFDQDHEAFKWLKADEILKKLKENVWKNKTDIALVHVGTYDILDEDSNESTVEDIEKIIEFLLSKNKDIKVLVAKPIPSTKLDYDLYIDLWDKIDELVSGMDNENVIVVNQTETFDARIHTFDGIHPNEEWEEIVADRWFEAIEYAMRLIKEDNSSK